MPKRVALVVCLLLAAVLVGCSGQTTQKPRQSQGSSSPTSAAETKAQVEGAPAYSARLAASDFVTGVTNPYFPLKPGSSWTYTTTTEDGEERNDVVVLEETRNILGIDAVVVHDTVTVDDELTEDTYDWYAQERDGTVWYLGEDTKELKAGKVVSTEGSWEAGVSGAQPGVIMQAKPTAGPWYWQEYFRGQAEDQARVLSLTGTADVPAGSFTDLLVTEERSPLEPAIVERKYYRRGVGVVLEQTTKGPNERSVLEETNMQ